MASTSCVRLFSAITLGSLSTMPTPFAYTRVFAVPRSIARSLARTPVLRGPVAIGGERLELALERVDTRVDARRLALAQPNDGAADGREQCRESEEQEIAHETASRVRGAMPPTRMPPVTSSPVEPLDASGDEPERGWVHPDDRL